MTEKIRVPRTTEAATTLLERFATVESDIAAIEHNRSICIADVNNRCDTAAQPLLEERQALIAALEPWWRRNAEALTQGKRKSIELGGCIVGSKTERYSLAIAGDEKQLAKVLAKKPWADGLTVVTLSLDKKAILQALDGKAKSKLTSLGFAKKGGEETFVLKRAEQQGTLAGTAS